jgi:WD40 repeat protein
MMNEGDSFDNNPAYSYNAAQTEVDVVDDMENGGYMVGDMENGGDMGVEAGDDMYAYSSPLYNNPEDDNPLIQASSPGATTKSASRSTSPELVAEEGKDSITGAVEAVVTEETAAPLPRRSSLRPSSRGSSRSSLVRPSSRNSLVRPSSRNSLVPKPSTPFSQADDISHGSIESKDVMNPEEDESLSVDSEIDLHNNRQIRTISFSPNGDFLSVAGDDKRVTIYSTSTRTIVKEFTSTGSILSLAYSPDGYLLSIGGDDQVVTTYDTTFYNVLNVFELKGDVEKIMYSPDGTTMAIGGSVKKVVVLNALTYQLVHEYDIGHCVLDLAYSPDGEFLAIGGMGGVVSIINNRELRVCHEFETPGTVRGIAYSPHGNLLSLARSVDNRDKRVSVYNTQEFELEQDYDMNDEVNAIAFSPYGNLFAVGGDDKKLTVYNMLSRQLVREIDTTQGVQTIAFSPNGNFLSIGGSDETVTTFHTATLEIVNEYKLNNTVDHQMKYSLTKVGSEKQVSFYDGENKNRGVNDIELNYDQDDDASGVSFASFNERRVARRNKKKEKEPPSEIRTLCTMFGWLTGSMLFLIGIIVLMDYI